VLSQLLTSYAQHSCAEFARYELSCIFEQAIEDTSTLPTENELPSLLAVGQLMKERRAVLFAELRSHWLEGKQLAFFDRLQQWRKEQLAH